MLFGREPTSRHVSPHDSSPTGSDVVLMRQPSHTTTVRRLALSLTAQHEDWLTGLIRFNFDNKQDSTPSILNETKSSSLSYHSGVDSGTIWTAFFISRRWSPKP